MRSARTGKAGRSASRPVMAVAWVVTGALTNLLPVFGEIGLLLIGGAGFLLSFAMMVVYGRTQPGARTAALS